ncbi:MAG TPA: hypothetical protein VGQ58_04505 [Candidatus Limnocylindrales bacterium]|jgi:hypothetical protein|nr:hypothetical protein [Candidatus Limnocylindrales bacterium]
MALPTYVGSSTLASGTGAITPGIHASTAVDDIMILVVESENEAISLSSAQGFVEGPDSPQSAGTAATSPASRLAWYWKRATVSGGGTAPTIADPGDHVTAAIHTFRGCIATGDPWDVTAGGNDGGVNDTTASIPGDTTTVANCLIVLLCSTSNNATSTTNFSGWTNADLANLTERFDSSNTAGLGGGHGMATGEKATAGVYGATTVTLSATSFKGCVSIALKPVAADTALVGSSAGIATAAGILATSITLAGSTAGVATAAGVLTTQIKLAGASAGAATASGLLTTQITLAGSAAGVASIAGALTTGIPLAGASAGVASAAGVLTNAPILFTGSSAGSSSAAGALTTSIALVGSSAGAGAASAALTTAIRFAGSAAGVSDAGGALTTAIRLAGVSAGSSSAAGILPTAGDTALAGASAGGSGAAGVLSTSIALVGQTDGLSAGVASLETAIALAGAAAGASSALAALATAIALAGSSAGSSAAAGILTDEGEEGPLMAVGGTLTAAGTIHGGSIERAAAIAGTINVGAIIGTITGG